MRFCSQPINYFPFSISLDRACGEHWETGGIVFIGGGSSPRMRGTHSDGATVAHERRFIPAHAGNTIDRHMISGHRTVHPRACGEHRRSAARLALIRGSSPRMRGTLSVRLKARLPHRFIPAHAGNTEARPLGLLGGPVHPRACGEHFFARSSTKRLNGSSPRMRGTRRNSLIRLL